MTGLDVATQNLVRFVKILSVIFNFTDAVVVRYVGRGSGVRSRPCHVSIDLFFAAPGRYYTARGRGVRRLPLSHLNYGFCPRLSVIWRCFSVRCLSGILPLPFSLSGHIRSAIFSVRSRSHFSGRLPLRMQCIPYPRTQSSRLQLQLVLYAHKVPGCSCSWYCTLVTNI